MWLGDLTFSWHSVLLWFESEEIVATRISQAWWTCKCWSLTGGFGAHARRYYSEELHRAAFILPAFARDALRNSLTI